MEQRTWQVSAHPPVGLEQRLMAWGPGLMWLVALISRGRQGGSQSLGGWRFHDLSRGGQVVATACGDAARTGWWALLGASPADLVELQAGLRSLRGAKHVTLSAEALAALEVADAPITKRVASRRASVALRCPPRSIEGELPGVGIATRRDLEALLAFPLSVEGSGPVATREVLAARIARGEVYVARDSGQIVSMAEGLRCGNTVDIQRLFTWPRHRRRGHARRLIRRIQKGAAQQDLETSLCVEVGNSAARALYQELGFVPIWERVDLDLSPSAA